MKYAWPFTEGVWKNACPLKFVRNSSYCHLPLWKRTEVKITRNVFWIPASKYLLSASGTSSREDTRYILGQVSNPEYAAKCLHIITDKIINLFYVCKYYLEVRRFFPIQNPQSNPNSHLKFNHGTYYCSLACKGP